LEEVRIEAGRVKLGLEKEKPPFITKKLPYNK
jgi:hypothetical protein